jgi:hypothetical protein
VRPASTLVEGSAPTYSVPTPGPVPVVVLGPRVPEPGDVLRARVIDGVWTAQDGGRGRRRHGNPCPYGPIQLISLKMCGTTEPAGIFAPPVEVTRPDGSVDLLPLHTHDRFPVNFVSYRYPTTGRYTFRWSNGPRFTTWEASKDVPTCLQAVGPSLFAEIEPLGGYHCSCLFRTDADGTPLGILAAPDTLYADLTFTSFGVDSAATVVLPYDTGIPGGGHWVGTTPLPFGVVCGNGDPPVLGIGFCPNCWAACGTSSCGPGGASCSATGGGGTVTRVPGEVVDVLYRVTGPGDMCYGITSVHYHE